MVPSLANSFNAGYFKNKNVETLKRVYIFVGWVNERERQREKEKVINLYVVDVCQNVYISMYFFERKRIGCDATHVVKQRQSMHYTIVGF